MSPAVHAHVVTKYAKTRAALTFVGRPAPAVERVFPFEALGDAFKHLQSGKATGRALLRRA